MEPLIFIFVLTAFLGLELLSKVPSRLHTPLMSGTNAISGIVLLGTISGAAHSEGLIFILYLGALFLSMVNVVGGYGVTHRMLCMFRSRSNS